MAAPSAVAPVGKRVQLVVSDPWDFVAADGSVRFAATVIGAATHGQGADEERLLLRLAEPQVWREKKIEFLVARERHGLGLVDDMALGQPVECSMVAVEPERANGPDPFDISWWRGGLAASATLREL